MNHGLYIRAQMLVTRFVYRVAMYELIFVGVHRD